MTDTSSTVAGIYNPFRYRGYVYDTETGLYYLQSRYYDPELGRFINADGLVSTGQGLLGYNMFAYCRNNPANKKDLNGYADEDTNEEKNQNIENMMQIFGVNSPDDLPELPENCMVFVENIRAFTLLGVTLIYGETIVMDNDKYCIYKFAGVGYGVSAIPYDYSITGGYVYNLKSVEDYCGFFFGASSNMAVDIKGGAVATNGVYAEIINGVGFGSSSLGISVTYYDTSQTDWIYGKAPMTLIEHPYTYFKQKKPWELDPATI